MGGGGGIPFEDAPGNVGGPYGGSIDFRPSSSSSDNTSLYHDYNQSLK